MPYEIEKKWLINHETIPYSDLIIDKRVEIEQTYVVITDKYEKRIRKSRCLSGEIDYEYTTKLTTKFDDTRIEVSEDDYSENEIKEMWYRLVECGNQIPIKKVRIYFDLDGYDVVIDTYENTIFEGLSTIEVEFDNNYEKDKFEVPDWFGEEVKISNADLWELMNRKNYPWR